MDIRKLQRAIVNGLEDVKAQDIAVFNTEQLSPLFERVVVASGTSNRQTKALASSVREAVKAAGGEILSVEGEDNGEWIIVDCGAAVAHIMQPAIRQYYHLEEIWGSKPVRMKLGAAGPRGLPKASSVSDEDEGHGAGEDVVTASRPRARRSGSAAEAKAPARKAPARKTATEGPGATKAPFKPAAKAPAKVARKRAARPADEASVQKVVIQPARKTAGKTASKTADRKTTRAPAAKKAAPRKTAARKIAAPRA